MPILSLTSLRSRIRAARKRRNGRFRPVRRPPRKNPQRRSKHVTRPKPPTAPRPIQYDQGKLALLIGCEYVNYARRRLDTRLPGCHRDIQEAYNLLTRRYNVDPKNIDVLSDGKVSRTRAPPTLLNIKNALQSLLQKSRSPSVSHLILYYSGHGLQVRDNSGDEADKKDEAIVPVDYKTSGFLTDDYIYEHFWKNLKPHIKQVTAIFDCCNSGTVLDLPYRYTSPNRIEKINTIPDMNSPLVISFSGCHDPQTSASAYNLERRKKWQGAMSWCLRTVLSQYRYGQIPLNELCDKVRAMLRARGFRQVPQLALSAPLPFNTSTSLF